MADERHAHERAEDQVVVRPEALGGILLERGSLRGRRLHHLVPVQIWARTRVRWNIKSATFGSEPRLPVRTLGRGARDVVMRQLRRGSPGATRRLVARSRLLLARSAAPSSPRSVRAVPARLRPRPPSAAPRAPPTPRRRPRASSRPPSRRRSRSSRSRAATAARRGSRWSCVRRQGLSRHGRLGRGALHGEVHRGRRPGKDATRTKPLYSGAKVVSAARADGRRSRRRDGRRLAHGCGRATRTRPAVGRVGQRDGPATTTTTARRRPSGSARSSRRRAS